MSRCIPAPRLLTLFLQVGIYGGSYDRQEVPCDCLEDIQEGCCEGYIRTLLVANQAQKDVEYVQQISRKWQEQLCCIPRREAQQNCNWKPYMKGGGHREKVMSISCFRVLCFHYCTFILSFFHSSIIITILITRNQKNVENHVIQRIIQKYCTGPILAII